MASATDTVPADGRNSGPHGHVADDHASQRASDDAALVQALTPTVELAIRRSVRRDPKPLADAIFPAIGPAIRKAIAAAIGGLIESMNHAAELALSFHALRWRIEAWRTGRTFGEVVIAHRLRYSVEQLFLIQRDSGLILAHVWRGETLAPDVVAGMLTAIQEFVRESFNLNRHEALRTLQAGDLTVLVEQGPAAIVAGVVRGYAPARASVALQDLLETLHHDFGDMLDVAGGDAATTAALELRLHDGLVTELAPLTTRRWRMMPLTVIATMGVAVIALWTLRSAAARSRWNAYVGRVRALPGVVIVENGRRDGLWFVSGLRDPLATDPQSLLDSAGIMRDQVIARWQPYLALEPPFVLVRARSALAPPPTVALAMTEGALTATGVASHDWMLRAERTAPALGVPLDMRALQDADVDALQREARAIGVLRVHFPRGSAEPTAEGRRVAGEVIARLRNLTMVAQSIDASVSIVTAGRTDETGTPSENEVLAAARAAYLQRRLAGLGITSRAVVQQGSGRGAIVGGAASDALMRVRERTALVLVEVRRATR